MLSSKFIKDSGANRLVAPIVQFKLQKRVKNDKSKIGGDSTKKPNEGNDTKDERISLTKEYELVPLTPMFEKFLNLMLSYTKGIFSSVSQMKRHLIKGAFITT